MTRLSGNNSNRSVLLIGTLLAAVLIGLALWAVQNRQKHSATSNGNVNFNLADTPFAGKADAPITVITVEDFKCPACKSFQDSSARVLQTKYVDTGKVKWYTMIWPFISEVAHNPQNDSKYAAEAAKCVYDQKGNDGFNAYKDILFRAQQSETIVWATKAYLKELAGNIDGLDTAKFATCLDTDATAARVEADKKQVEDAKVDHTPTVYVNGKEVTITADAVQDISAAIDAAAK